VPLGNGAYSSGNCPGITPASLLSYPVVKQEKHHSVHKLKIKNCSCKIFLKLAIKLAVTLIIKNTII
jgi:hypothetical protein